MLKGCDMDAVTHRKALLNGRKTERINFAVTPDMKKAAESLAENRCVSLSALISTLLADAIVSAGSNGTD